ncbi:hypothetical protein Tco_0113094 [Tanacetum coccineum]
MKAITIRSGVAYEEPSIPTNHSPKKTLPKTTPIPKSDISKSLPKPNIPYPSRRDDQKFAPTIKSLLMNKEKLFELAKIPLNENCSSMLLKMHPEKVGDPDKFLIPCNFPGIDVKVQDKLNGSLQPIKDDSQDV